MRIRTRPPPRNRRRISIEYDEEGESSRAGDRDHDVSRDLFDGGTDVEDARQSTDQDETVNVDDDEETEVDDVRYSIWIELYLSYTFFISYTSLDNVLFSFILFTLS